MISFCFYFITALITGFHALLALGAYGLPFNPLELLSLLGSLCLLMAAYVSLFRPHAGARVALLACLLIWCFYGPAISKSIRTKASPKHSASANRVTDPPELGSSLGSSKEP